MKRWILFIGYYAAIVSQHLNFSHIITGELWFKNTLRLSDIMHIVGWIGAGLVLCWISIQYWRVKASRITLLFWGLWALCIIVTVSVLQFHPNELFHYPQYALLSILLAWCIDPQKIYYPFGKVLFWTTILSICDEAYQYFFLCTTYGMYFDLNDCFMNMLGAAAGMLLRYGFQKPLSIRNAIGSFPLPHLKEAWMTIILCALAGGLLFSGNLRIKAPSEIPPGGVVHENSRAIIYLERIPHITGSWVARPGGGKYYVFAIHEGIAAIIFIGYLFTCYPSVMFRFSRSGDEKT